MATPYKHKRSATANKVPVAADFSAGEILVNTADGRAFVQKGAGVATLPNQGDNDARYVRHDTASQGLNSTQQGNARANIGAQPALGYTPANKAGDTFTSTVFVQAAAAACRLVFRNAAAANVVETGVGVGTGFGDSYGTFVSNSTGGLYLGTNGATRLSINASGAVAISGTLSKGGGTFLIDHPLDPLNRNLRHGFVEAPRYDLIYRGVVRLIDGVATVDIDAASNMTSGTFAVLTTNARVTSLQNQEGFARCKPGAITGGSFQIICEDDGCADEIAWVVIAERDDPFVKSDAEHNCDSDGRFIPEFDKPEPPHAAD